MTDPAQRKLAQIICVSCPAKHFFVYVIEGEVEIICTECGSRGGPGPAQGRQISGQP